jgi:uncharacterized repeat protein (TIGR01451 family)
VSISLNQSGSSVIFSFCTLLSLGCAGVQHHSQASGAVGNSTATLAGLTSEQACSGDFHAARPTVQFRNSDGSREQEDIQFELQTQAPAAVLCDQPITWNFTVRNTGTKDVKQMRIVDDLPTGLTAVDGQQRIELEVGCLHAGQSRDFRVEVKSGQPGKFHSQARLEGPGGYRLASNAIATTIKSPTLQIEINALRQMYAGTRPLAYRVTVRNSGEILARKVQLWSVLPDGAEFLSATDGGAVEDGILAWNLGQLAAQESRVLSFSLKPTTLGKLETTLSASALGMPATQMSWNTKVLGLPALHLAVADLQDPVQIGEACTYQITVSNSGSAAAESIEVTMELPQFMVWDQLSSPVLAHLEGQEIRFAELAELAAGQSVTYELQLRGTAEREQKIQVSMTSARSSEATLATVSTYIYQ